MEKNTLERRVLAAAKWMIRAAEKHKPFESKASETLIPFNCDGVIDHLYFNNVEKKWSRIEYFVGKGDGVLANEEAGFYDETEMRTIYL